MKTTITDISKDTGLSLATISKYLNNKPVLPENKKKIERSIQKLHYTPNQIAQSLRSKKTRTVAIVLPPLSDSIWGRIVNPIGSTLTAAGYTPITCTSNPAVQEGASLSEFLLHNQIGGVIAIDNAFSREELLLFSDNHIPVVCVDCDSTSLSIDCVVSANFRSAYEAGTYLIEKNHRKIGIIGGSRRSYSIQERRNGFLQALNDHQIPVYPEYCHYDALTISDAQRCFHQLFTHPSPPSAVFLLNYTAFMGSLMEIVNNQIDIPGDISLLCFERDTIFDALSPRITSIEQDFEALGKQAARLFLEALARGKGTPAKRLLVPTAFLEGDSVSTLSPLPSRET